MEQNFVAGLTAHVGDDGIFVRASGRAGALALGGPSRAIPWADVDAIEINQPTALARGSIRIGTPAGQTQLIFDAKRRSAATELFDELARRAPDAVGRPVVSKLWNAKAERLEAKLTPIREVNDARAAERRERREWERSPEGKASREAESEAVQAARREEMAQHREAELARKRALDAKTGPIIADALFDGHRIVIYKNGYIACGRLKLGPPKKLVAIRGSADVQKKSALGRTLAGAVTLGATLGMSPNKRGDAYLTIVT